MCGICGFVGFEDKALLKKMMDSIKHRGPDDSGVFIDKGISLGHRRLSIIDLKTGKQPMKNEDGTIQIVFNGEIYNFQELRTDLEKKGHKFYTNSDTEVIIHAYEEYGKNCLKRFNGMFAFAIWDSKKKSLFLARDRLGIKPLYYTFFNGSLIFASEIKAILQHPDVKKDVDFQAMNHYFSLGYVPAPRTMFDGIKKLSQSHCLEYDVKEKKPIITKYWNLVNFESENKSIDYYTKNLSDILESSVKKRLMSDVPLGAFLSGGLDSSAVVAIMSKLSEKPVKTISAGFEEGGHYDESNFSRMVAERFNTDHHEVVLKTNDIKMLPKIVWHFDEPVLDGSSVPEFMISEKAKKHVTVALVGEGGDELFMGYRQYKIMKLSRYFLLPKYMKKTIIPKISKSISGIIPRRKPKRYLEFLADFSSRSGNFLEIYKSLLETFNKEDKDNLFLEKIKKGMKDNIVVEDYFKDEKKANANISSFELKVPLPDILLMNVDKMSMANSIEARVPFLDHKLVEFSAKIPFNMKLKGFTEKYILKRAMQNELPKEIIKRKKHPFAVPIISWLENDLKEISDHLLSKRNIEKQGYFNSSYVDKINKSKNYNQLWPLVFFQMWHKTYIENDAVKGPLAFDSVFKDISQL
ncbi:MAG: asparagine synthase (glutamine-hydrolyzing) [Candidatus Aenigmarchaeota archaeon]|nr:asparagine synthase (glutamine-hydrolyzing) [Candidatus Aenigmarchaeota archaeon]